MRKASDIAVAESGGGEFATGDAFEQGKVVGITEAHSPNGTAIVGDPMIHGIEQVRARGLVAHGAERIEIGFVGSLGQLGAAMEICNAFA